MMSDSDDEELAALRKERDRRQGTVTRVSGGREGDHEKEGNAELQGLQMRHFLPSSFGETKIRQIHNETRKEKGSPAFPLLGRPKRETPVEDFVGPSLPAEIGSESAVQLKMNDMWNLPITSEVTLEPHAKGVLSLDVDPSGSRLITGSADHMVKIFDFNGMKSDFKSFKSFEPSEGHPVLGLSWSPTGDSFLVITGSAQPKVYTRDGVEEGEFPRGDMYIRDLKNTKGHITSCTDGQWHPNDKGYAVTSSADGTVRVWDMWSLSQHTVIKPSLKKPGRVSVTSLRYSSDGKTIAGGLEDGTIHMWDVRTRMGHKASTGMVAASKFQSIGKQNWNFVNRESKVVRSAHEQGSDITCLRVSRNGNNLISRSSDETLKLWDLRKFQTPLAVAEGLETGFGNIQCCFSPNEEMVLTGVAATQTANGHVSIFDASSLSLVKRLGAPGSVVPVLWHPKLNQIIFGCGDRKMGSARVLYDVGSSTNGVLLAVGKKPRKTNISDFAANVQAEIYHPNALPLYREDLMNKKRSSSSAMSKSAKLFKPDQGALVAGKGAEGKLGTSTGSLLTQYLMKDRGVLKNPADEDVRASILRHADKESEFARFTNAYSQTQPTRIYADEDSE